MLSDVWQIKVQHIIKHSDKCDHKDTTRNRICNQRQYFSFLSFMVKSLIKVRLWTGISFWQWSFSQCGSNSDKCFKYTFSEDTGMCSTDSLSQHPWNWGNKSDHFKHMMRVSWCVDRFTVHVLVYVNIYFILDTQWGEEPMLLCIHIWF